MEVVIENLSKVFPGGVRALDSVCLRVSSGVFGLLGPNGAGKSTLMRILATLLRPDAGRVQIGSLDVVRDAASVRGLLGYLPQEFGFYPTLTAEATLDHFAALRGVTDRRERVSDLLERVGLYDVRRRLVGGYSGGMKQRLGIAIALVGDPTLIVVDEPTAGLDPTERHRLLNLLSEAGEDATVVLSTHIVEDIRDVCERMAILTKGRVIAQGGPEEVIARITGRLYRRAIDRNEVLANETNYQVVCRRLIGGKPMVFVYAESDPGDGFVPVDASLEDAYFFHMTAD